jgi:hypothetical protein
MELKVKKILALIILILFTTACDSDNEDYADLHTEPALIATLSEEAAKGEVHEIHIGAKRQFTDVFPSIYITVDNPGLPFNRELWRDVTVTITGADDIPPTVNVPAAMRGRGNTSWTSSPDKRPFRLRFDRVRQQMPFSSVAARDWTFLSQHADYTLMRAFIGFNLSHEMGGMTVAPFASFIHVYVDDEYMGVYINSSQVNDMVRCGDNGRRASLIRNDNPALSEFMLERCYRGLYNGLHMGYELFRAGGIQYEIRFGRTWPEHNEYVSHFMTRVHDAIMAQDPAVFDMINFQSFVDWYVIHELFRDHDAGRTSSFMQLRLDENGRRYLELGPVWDFDHAAGNSNWQLPSHPYHVWVPYGNPYHEGRYAHIWFRSLLEMPEFYHAVTERLIEMRDYYLPAMLEYVAAFVDNYIACFRRNFERHPVFNREVMGMSRELTELNNFEEHLYFLFNWLTIRADWLVGYFTGSSPYFYAEAVQFSDKVVQAGSYVNLIHLNVQRTASRTTSGELTGFMVYHNGSIVAEGRFAQVYGGEIIFGIPNATPYHAGEYTLIILYTKRWQATELMPQGSYAPVRRVATRLQYGSVELVVR